MFCLDPERAHHITLSLLHFVLKIPGGKRLFHRLFTIKHALLHRKVWGLDFPNPVGLAAGFDKDGKYYEDMTHLGFGFIEIGTVTPLPQSGNEKPRLFRLPKNRALINRMGFNNDGVDSMVLRLKSKNSNHVIIGGNIGKNKNTPNENASKDYTVCFNALYPYVDYFVVNVSSPNTPGLRELQEKEPLSHLLTTLMHENISRPAVKPILLKISPDLSPEQLDDVIQIVQDTGIHGIIATNTTLDRSGIVLKDTEIGAGGLSGHPLQDKSTEVIRYIHQKSGGLIKIIGVGGISSPKDALEKIMAGASLVQVYSGLVFEGPGLIKKINQHILENTSI